MRPEALRSTVVSLVENARTQAATTVEKLAEHGAEVVEDLRRQPAFRKVVRRAERAVDAVEDTLEDVLEETAETVVEASNKATSVAQKTAARVDEAWIVADAGTIVNPLLAEGQRHGGYAQGVAQALLEEVLYDSDGNPQTSTLSDYPFVSATELK